MKNVNNAQSATAQDMLHGPLIKKIFLFALPLALGGIIQQLFTSADMAVIYWFEGAVEQSAVNSNGALVNLILNLFTGLSVGATVVIAEEVGKRQTDDIHSIVLTAFVISLISGVIILGVGIGLSEPLLRLMNTPKESFPLAVEYLRIYFLGMPFLMVYDFGAAVLRGVGDTKKALIILFASGVLNVGMNILFVGPCKMSVAGVAVATLLANTLSAVMVSVFVMRDGMFRIRKSSRVRKQYVKRIFVIGLPAGLQGVVFSISNVIIQSSINEYGPQAVAGNGDALNFEMFVYFFVSAFAQTTVTFFGQNFAAGEYGRCKVIFRISMIGSIGIATVLGGIFVLGADFFIRIYTTDAQSVEYALIRMRTVLTCSMLAALYEVPGGALRGMGHSFLPALFTIIGSCIFRIVWIYTVYQAAKSYALLVAVYPITWVITGLAIMLSYYIIGRKCGIYSKKPKVAVQELGAMETAADIGQPLEEDTTEIGGETAKSEGDNA